MDKHIIEHPDNNQDILDPCPVFYKHTIRPETNSNDFGGFVNKVADSNSIFVAAEMFFERFRIFGVFKVQSHTMWPYMCLCCGLFVPTQFHFECCGVFDESR